MIFFREFNRSKCLLVDKERILVFNVSEDQNISFQYLWEIEPNDEGEYLLEPLPYDDEKLYIGTNRAYNYIFDITDFEYPVLENNWIEDNNEIYGYCINNEFLYRSKYDNGIWKYDLSILPSIQYDEYGDVFPYRSTAYFDGYIYKNYPEYLYKINPITYEEEIICDLPFNTGWDYYKLGNLMMIFENYGLNGSFFCDLIDLCDNQFLNHIEINGPILTVQNNKLFIQNGNVVEVVHINESNELEYLTEFNASSMLLITEFDENHIWVSYHDGDFLFNSVTLEIDYDFSDYWMNYDYLYLYQS